MGDLREWIETMDTHGELRTVYKADWDVELGVIVDQYQRRMNLPALLFDEIKGYPKGFRVLANTLTSTKRIALTLGLPAESSEMELVHAWRRFSKENSLVPPQIVQEGPVNENLQRGTMWICWPFQHLSGTRKMETGTSAQDAWSYRRTLTTTGSMSASIESQSMTKKRQACIFLLANTAA